MTDPTGPAAASRPVRPARHERPAIDDAALAAARAADRVLAGLRARGSDRWIAYFEPLPGRLRDDEIRALRSTALRVRAAYGPADSVREVLPDHDARPLLEAVDRLLKLLARRDLHDD